MLRTRVRDRLRQYGLEITIVSKDVGYELRSADPIPFDMEYTRDLGYCGAQYLLEGGSGAMVSMQRGRFVPIPFDALMDPESGRMTVRMVDIESTRYAIARRYMIRLDAEDFRDEGRLAALAGSCGLTAEAFRQDFQPVCDDDQPPLRVSG